MAEVGQRLVARVQDLWCASRPAVAAGNLLLSAAWQPASERGFCGCHVAKFAVGFTAIFWISYACWIVGSYAYIAATPDKLAKLGISWSLNLTPEAGFIIALIAGLMVGNFFPRFARLDQDGDPSRMVHQDRHRHPGRCPWGCKPAAQWGLAKAVMFRGLCAIVEAYLIYWALVYFVARKFFKFSREWAVPLASGISICGVSAAIATGAAIKARPIVPIMVSSLVVIFAVVELLVLPFAAQQFLYKSRWWPAPGWDWP